jgi:hypothetical protein
MVNGAIGEMVWAAEQYYSIDRHVIVIRIIYEGDPLDDF